MKTIPNLIKYIIPLSSRVPGLTYGFEHTTTITKLFNNFNEKSVIDDNAKIIVGTTMIGFYFISHLIETKVIKVPKNIVEWAKKLKTQAKLLILAAIILPCIYDGKGFHNPNFSEVLNCATFYFVLVSVAEFIETVVPIVLTKWYNDYLKRKK